MSPLRQSASIHDRNYERGRIRGSVYRGGRVGGTSPRVGAAWRWAVGGCGCGRPTHDGILRLRGRLTGWPTTASDISPMFCEPGRPNRNASACTDSGR